MQCVGKTVQKLNERFNWHRNEFNEPGKYGFCFILSDQFHNSVCCGASYLVPISEKLEGNGRTANASDASITSRSKQRGKKRMLKLRTLYP